MQCKYKNPVRSLAFTIVSTKDGETFLYSYFRSLSEALEHGKAMDRDGYQTTMEIRSGEALTKRIVEFCKECKAFHFAQGKVVEIRKLT